MKTPDYQYQNLIKYILENGDKVSTPQDVDAITCFGTAPTLIYDLSNGDPIITERKMGIKGPIAEITAFINGEQDFTTMQKEYGVPEPFWGPWTTEKKTKKVGAKPNCLGDGSYGRAFAAFPDNNGGEYDQVLNIIRMLSDEKLRNRRTIYMSSWIPFMNGWGANQKTVVSPCHGFVHFRVLDGKLDMISWHRAADILLGFPNDMISYVAFMKMISEITGLEARRIIFQLGDAHIYENQLDQANELLSRKPFIFPTLKIKNTNTNIRDFRATDFEIIGYETHDKMIIPSAI